MYDVGWLRGVPVANTIQNKGRVCSSRCSLGSGGHTCNYPTTLCIRNDGGGCWTDTAASVSGGSRWSSPTAARRIQRASNPTRRNQTRSRWCTAAARLRCRSRDHTGRGCERCTRRSWWTLSRSDTAWVWWTVSVQSSPVLGDPPSAEESRSSVFGPSLQASGSLPQSVNRLQQPVMPTREQRGQSPRPGRVRGPDATGC